MKRYLVCGGLALAFVAAQAQVAMAATPSQEIPAQQLGIVPEPLSVKAFASTYTLPQAPTISASNADERNVAGFLIKFLQSRGISATVAPQSGRANIRLSTDANDPSIGKEGYHLVVSSSDITISANAGAGLFYGLQTLEQIFPAPPLKSATIHQVDITDQPRFQWRGILFDSARHFFPVSFVENLINEEAAYKLNMFHWHLTDDQGWRIQIKGYPRLTQVGSCGDKQHALGTAPCRLYTQEQIKQVVAYAKERYVTIVPEIEMPGHSAAALAAYPDLACKPITGNVYCPSKQTFKFLETVLDQVMQLFPSRYIHTGGDEVHPQVWDASPVAQAVMRKHRLKDASALQGWIDQRIEKYLARHGRRDVGWDEILRGKILKSTVVISWRGTNGGIIGTGRGNDVVMAPASSLYFDASQAPHAWEPPATARITTLHDVYNYGPDLKDIPAKEQSHFIGVEGCLWTEEVPTPKRAWYRLFPRVLALSEVAWTAGAQKNWHSFEQRTRNQYPRLSAKGITYFIPGPFQLKDTITDKSQVDVTLTSPVPDSTMYYTSDGSYPTTSSTLYDSPFTISLNPGAEVRLRVITVLASGRTSAPAVATYMRRQSTPPHF